MATREEVVAAARRWIGVRWRHQGRTRDGVDCVGLIISVARDAALVDEEALQRIERQTAGYGRYPIGGSLKAALDAELTSVASPQPGDVVLLRLAGELRHVGIVGEHPAGGYSLIHSNSVAPRKVIEHVMPAGVVACAYALPGVC